MIRPSSGQSGLSLPEPSFPRRPDRASAPGRPGSRADLVRLPPDLVRDLRDEFQLAFLHAGVGQVGADQHRGEAALGRDAEPVQAHVASGLAHPGGQLLGRFQRRGLIWRKEKRRNSPSVTMSRPAPSCIASLLDSVVLVPAYARPSRLRSGVAHTFLPSPVSLSAHFGHGIGQDTDPSTS